MAKNKNSGKPMAGSTMPLQPMVVGNDLKIDPRMEPCGDNKLVTKKTNDSY